MSKRGSHHAKDAGPSMDLTIMFHGRQFQKHAIEKEVQFLPIDKDEIERLNQQHIVFQRIFDNKLIIPNMADPRSVLDLGCGTAAWAASVADMFPECKVVGVDITLQMLPPDLPKNFEAQIADLNEPLNFKPDTFDVVSSRAVGTGIDSRRWLSYVKDIKKVLKPGGWCQIGEFYHNAQSDNGLMTSEHALRQWSEQYLAAVEKVKDPRASRVIDSMLREAGMINVETRRIDVPLCGWSNGKYVQGPADIAVQRDQATGQLQMKITGATLRNLSLYPLVAKEKMGIDAFDALIDRATADALNRGIKAYFPFYLDIAQKPWG